MFSRLLTPSLIVAHVRDIPPTRLKEKGIRAIVTDLDNTLVPWKSDEIVEEIVTWLTALRDADMKVCIASNTRRLTRLERIAGNAGILHVPGNAGKPGTRGLQTALTLLGSTPAETAMVGDQLFTDMLAGNRLGLTTVLVNPLSTQEFIGTRVISRPLEKIFLRGERKRVL